MRAEAVRTRVTAFQWIAMLLRQRPAALLRHAEALWPALLDSLGDEAEETEYFATALGKLASLVVSSTDLPFCALMVQTLNGILHSSPALRELRESLRAAMSDEKERGAELFKQLYAAWCHAPVALLSLCLLAEAHEHASELISRFAAVEGGEMSHPALVAVLYGLLMLLPQSGAFQTLQQRLSLVPQLGLLRLHIGGRGRQQQKAAIDFGELQGTFERVQQRYREHRRALQEQQRLSLLDDDRTLG
ncbi:vacuolar protein 14 C-terminal Fig4p binding-domain-containing protein [Pavlovales sp. CCMP2436]|nr:vacuolar protein 14 C-terminal Fig4p binding-domain-containing protein [Pavlovales sp. CCMP2436]